MHPDDLQAIFLEQETASPSEIYRRIGVFLDALAAMPKPSWRPVADARGIRTEGPGLSRMRRLIDRLEISLDGRAVVHVAGTSGKGSSALMIAGSLHAAGRRTAAFFSPHLTSLAERFWICGRFAEAESAGRCAARIAEEGAVMAREEDVGPPSYFEATLALLLLAAEEADCEFIVLEAGLGGTFDATNAVGPASLDVITSIGLDHTDLLGETIGQIARDKAGIITPGGRVITGALGPEAREEVDRVAKERGAGMVTPPEAMVVLPDEKGCVFDLGFPGGEVWEGVRTRMAGPHQARNAALAAGRAGSSVWKRTTSAPVSGPPAFPAGQSGSRPEWSWTERTIGTRPGRSWPRSAGFSPGGDFLFWARSGTRIIPASPRCSPGQEMGSM